MDWRDYIHSVDGIGSGRPIFKGTRLKVEMLLKLMAAGWSEQQIMDEYPGFIPEHLRAAAAFAAELIGEDSAISIYQARAA